MNAGVIAAVLLSVAGAAPARADSCTTGTYQATVAPLLKMLPDGGNRIALRDGRIHIDGCPVTPAVFKPRRKSIQVTVEWPECPGLGGRARLRARLDRTCEKMTGRLKVGRRYRKRFTATATSSMPPPTVIVDTAVLPEVTAVPGFDGAPDRPVAALTDASGVLTHFVENELLVVSDDEAAVAALASRLGGTVVRSLPSDAGLGGAAHHLVRIDPNAVDGAGLVGDLQQLAGDTTGALRLSSDAGMRLLAAAAHERVAGLTVALNAVIRPTSYRDRTTTENASLPICPSGPDGAPTNAAGCVPKGIDDGTTRESFDADAFTWSYMGTGPGTQDIGVGEAWRALDLAGRLGNRVTIAVIDGGFAPAVDYPAGWVHHPNSIHVDAFPRNEFDCTDGLDCPWHGTNVVSAAMAVPDDGQGAAGPAGPIAQAVTIRISGDVFNALGAFAIAFTSGARVLNMSGGFAIPALLSWVVEPFDLVTKAARARGLLIVAAAGNEGLDVDGEDCAPPFDVPCWEKAWWVPCENGGVTCIGALADNSDRKRAKSNYGGEDVDLFGPGSLWVGGDPDDLEPHLFYATSAAAPFVAGVGALVMAADPSLDADDVEHILLETAHASSDTRVGRYVDAYGAVLQALGGSPDCPRPQITYLSPSRKSLPCGANEFRVAHVDEFGPYQYVWRKYQGTVPVDLAEGGNVTGSRTARMVIDPLHATDVGTYDVVVTNLCGSTRSAPIGVSVAEGTLRQSTNLRGPRRSHAMAYDRGRGRMVLHGGMKESTGVSIGVSDETWERSDDGSWQLVTRDGPPPRFSHAMAYDEARGVTVLFGGQLCPAPSCAPGSPSGQVTYADTWEWDGSTWTERIVANPPLARVFHAMTYDSVRRRVVMHGGQSADRLFLNDLWEWNGTTWSARPQSFDGPLPRRSHGLAFDRLRNVLLLHGGIYYLQPPQTGGDTWELAGNQWTLRATPPSPTSELMNQAGLAFDSDKGRMLLHTASCNTGECRGVLWEWTGSAWRSMAVLPNLLDGARLEYDSGRKRTTLAGGEGLGLTPQLDVWDWQYVDADPTCSGSP